MIVNISTFQVNGQGSAMSEVSDAQVVQPSPTGRAVSLRLSLPTRGSPIRVNPEAVVFNLAFSALKYNALQPIAPLPAGTKQSLGGGVVVQLDAPREVVKVLLSAGAPEAVKSAAIGFHRVDLNSVAGDETLSAAAFTLARGFIDARFVLKSKSAATLTPAAIAGVEVRSFPTGPRVRLITPGAPGPGTLVWSASGEFDHPKAPGALNVQIGAQLAEALVRHLADSPRTDPLLLDLVIESDAPCQAAVSSCRIGYTLESRFPPNGGKIILRFPGQADTRRTIDVPIPSGTSPTKAVLHAVASFSGSGATVGVQDSPVNFEPPRQVSGIDIEQGVRAAVLFTAESPIHAAGIATVLSPITGDVAARLDVHDLGQAPGAILAGGALIVRDHAWVTAIFDKPIIIQPPGVWIVLTVSHGRLAWLADQDDHARVTAAKHDQSWSAGRSICGFRPVVHLLPIPKSQSITPPPLLVSIGDRVFEPDTMPDGQSRYDVTPAVSGSAGPRTISIDFRSPLRGVVTIPRIELECEAV